MNIFGFEIRRVRQHRSMLPQIPIEEVDADLLLSLAVPDTTAWWRAVNQIVDQAELESMKGARKVTHDPNKCIAAVGSGEGCDLIRQKLKDARKFALTNYRTGK